MNNLNKNNLINKLENKLKISFDDKKLYKRALVHKSYANEKKISIKDNERLEFLGDAVLDLSISSYLFEKYTDLSEGDLAKMRSVLVNELMLSKKAKELELGQYLLLGKGEENTGGRNRKSILADTMEALLGAIYLDKNFEYVNKFIIDFFKEDIKKVEQGNYIKDYKTNLQELIQKNNTGRPIYEVLSAEGPDHNKIFTVRVKFKNQILGKGKAKTKKEAQQEAAKKALKNLKQI